MQLEQPRTAEENTMLTQGLQPYVNTTEEPPIYFLGLPTILRATGQTTNGAFGLVENVMPPGFASPYHVHHLEDEAFYVLEGEMAFVCDGKWTAAGPGTYIFGPRNLPHGFKVLGDAPARMLLLCTPGGFEQFVVEMSEPTPAPPDMAKLMAVAAKYSIDILGPLPEQPDVPARPASARSSASLKDAVDRIRTEHVAAVNAGDIDAALSIFAPDVAVMPPGRPVLQGAALRTWYTEVFENFSLRGFDIRPDAVDEFGNAVIEHGNWNATLQPKNGSPSQPVGGTYVTAYARVADGSVRVIRDIFNGMPA
jgi:ketosteroid isomerase-like protein/quercetin dioxygenase-like cupin family protein